MAIELIERQYADRPQLRGILDGVLVQVAELSEVTILRSTGPLCLLLAPGTPVRWCSPRREPASIRASGSTFRRMLRPLACRPRQVSETAESPRASGCLRPPGSTTRSRTGCLAVAKQSFSPTPAETKPHEHIDTTPSVVSIRWKTSVIIIRGRVITANGGHYEDPKSHLNYAA